MAEARRSSILKPPKQRAPLQDVNSLNIPNEDDFNVVTITAQHLMRRVSFAGTSTVKEFDTHAESVLVCHTPAYEESFATSDSSVPSDLSSRLSSRSTSSLQDQSSLPSQSQSLNPDDPEVLMLKDFGFDSFDVPPASASAKPPRYSLAFALPENKAQESPKLREEFPSPIPSGTFYSKSKPKPRPSHSSSPRTQEVVTIDPLTLRPVVKSYGNPGGGIRETPQPKATSKCPSPSPKRRRSMAVPSQNDSSSSEMDLTEAISGDIFLESPAVNDVDKAFNQTKLFNVSSEMQMDMTTAFEGPIEAALSFHHHQKVLSTLTSQRIADGYQSELNSSPKACNRTVTDSVDIECTEVQQTHVVCGGGFVDSKQYEKENIRVNVPNERTTVVTSSEKFSNQTGPPQSGVDLSCTVNNSLTMDFTRPIETKQESLSASNSGIFVNTYGSFVKDFSCPDSIRIDFCPPPESLSPGQRGQTLDALASPERSNAVSFSQNNERGVADMELTKVSLPVLNRISGAVDKNITQTVSQIENSTFAEANMEFTKAISAMRNSSSGTDLDFTRAVSPTQNSTLGPGDMEFTKAISMVLSSSSGTVVTDFTKMVSPMHNSSLGPVDMKFTKVIPAMRSSSSEAVGMDFTRTVSPMPDSSLGPGDMEFTKAISEMQNTTIGTFETNFTKTASPMQSSILGPVDMELTKAIPEMQDSIMGTFETNFTKTASPMQSSTLGSVDMELTKAIPEMQDSIMGTFETNFTKTASPMQSSTLGPVDMELTKAIPEMQNHTLGPVDMEFTKVIPAMHNSTTEQLGLDYTRVTPPALNSTCGMVDEDITRRTSSALNRTSGSTDLEFSQVIPARHVSNSETMRSSADMEFSEINHMKTNREPIRSFVYVDSTKVIPGTRIDNGVLPEAKPNSSESQFEAQRGSGTPSCSTLVTSRINMDLSQVVSNYITNKHLQSVHSKGNEVESPEKDLETKSAVPCFAENGVERAVLRVPDKIQADVQPTQDSHLAPLRMDLTTTAPIESASHNFTAGQSSYASSESILSTQIDRSQFSAKHPAISVTESLTCRKRSFDESTDYKDVEQNQSKKCYLEAEPSVAAASAIVIPSSRSPSPIDQVSSLRFPGLCRSISDDRGDRRSVSPRTASPPSVESNLSSADKQLLNEVPPTANLLTAPIFKPVQPDEIWRNNTSPSTSERTGICSFQGSNEGSPIVPMVSEAAVISSQISLGWTPAKNSVEENCQSTRNCSPSPRQDGRTKSRLKFGEDNQTLPCSQEEQSRNFPLRVEKDSKHRASFENQVQMPTVNAELTKESSSELEPLKDELCVGTVPDSKIISHLRPAPQSVPMYQNGKLNSKAHDCLENKCRISADPGSENICVPESVFEVQAKCHTNNEQSSVPVTCRGLTAIGGSGAPIRSDSLDIPEHLGSFSIDTDVKPERTSFEIKSNSSCPTPAEAMFERTLHKSIADESLPSMVDISDTGNASCLEHDISSETNLQSVLAVASFNVEAMTRDIGKKKQKSPAGNSQDFIVADRTPAQFESASDQKVPPKSDAQDARSVYSCSSVLAAPRCGYTCATEAELKMPLERMVSPGGKASVSPTSFVLPEDSPYLEKPEISGNRLGKLEISKVKKSNSECAPSEASLEEHTAVITKPKIVSLDEIFKNHRSRPFKHWVAQRIYREKWSFVFLQCFVELRLTVEEPGKEKQISGLNGHFIPLFEGKLEEVPLMAGRLLFQKLSSDEWASRIKKISDVLNLLDDINAIADDVKQFVYEVGLLIITRNAQVTSDWFLVDIVSMKMELWFKLKVDCLDLGSIKPADISIENIIGNTREADIQNLVTCIKKDEFFLKSYVELVEEYVKTLEKVWSS